MNDPFDECQCGHLREDHDPDCTETAISGYKCACDEFEEALI